MPAHFLDIWLSANSLCTSEQDVSHLQEGVSSAQHRLLNSTRLDSTPLHLRLYSIQLDSPQLNSTQLGWSVRSIPIRSVVGQLRPAQSTRLDSTRLVIFRHLARANSLCTLGGDVSHQQEGVSSAQHRPLNSTSTRLNLTLLHSTPFRLYSTQLTSTRFTSTHLTSTQLTSARLNSTRVVGSNATQLDFRQTRGSGVRKGRNASRTGLPPAGGFGMAPGRVSHRQEGFGMAPGRVSHRQEGFGMAPVRVSHRQEGFGMAPGGHGRASTASPSSQMSLRSI